MPIVDAVAWTWGGMTFLPHLPQHPREDTPNRADAQKLALTLWMEYFAHKVSGNRGLQPANH
jgi:hypothetical protein